jgi:large subunit ribosomal protein L7/L12
MGGLDRLVGARRCPPVTGLRVSTAPGKIRRVSSENESSPPPSVFHIDHLFPVEGDTAIAELCHRGEVWADLRLAGVRTDSRGEERVAEARPVLRIYPRPAGAEPIWWEWDLDAVSAQLAEARDWLLDNERGREPILDPDDLTAAGRALTKASAETIGQWSAAVPPASSPPTPEFGTGTASVVLREPGPTPILLIRQLRAITGFGLHDARALLERVPSTVATGLSRADALQISRILESAGATVEIN